MASAKLKLVTYRGGLVKFYVPTTWVEEYEPNGGGTFYADIPNSGTLRLNVLTFQNEAVHNDKTASDFLANSAIAKAGKITSLPNGNILLTYHEDDVEENENLCIYFWHIVNYLPPKYTRIAVFSYTFSAGQEGDPTIANELRIINEQIPKATFALELGKQTKENSLDNS